MKTFTHAVSCKKAAIIFFVVALCLVNSVRSLCQTWTGNFNTNWNIALNWLGNSVPTSSGTVIIPNGLTNYPVISAGINALATSITINSGASLTMTGTGNLTISTGGSFTNNGTFTSTGTGAIIFNGSGTVNGLVTFKNVTINGAVDFGSTGVSTVSGNLIFNPGGSVGGSSTHLITFTSSSTLVYNTSIIVGNEWYQGGSGTVNPGAGIPQNINIQSGTITIPNAGGTNRALAGDLTINSGATLQITSGSRDVFIAGNWTNNGIFITNGRRVTFDAASGSTQTVSGNTIFYDLTLDNSGATTDFGSSITTINDEFRISHGTMDGNASTFIFNGNSCTLEGIGAKRFYIVQIVLGSKLTDLTPTAGDTHISNNYTNDGVFKQFDGHTTYFDKSGGTENLSGNGSTTFGNITIGKSGTIGAGTTLNANAHNFTVAGTDFIFNHSSSVFNGGTGTVTFNGITDLISNATSVSFTTANFYGIKILNTTTLGMDITVNESLFISSSANTLAMNGNTLTLNGTVSGSGALKGSATSNLTIGSNGNLGTLYFDQSINNTTNVLKNFIVNTNASVTLGNALNITAGTATPYGNTSGTIAINGTLNANGNLTLKSNQYGDAVVGVSNGSIINNATVERYIPAKRAWRFLSVPFASSTQTIKAAWQEGATNLSIDCANNQLGAGGSGYGTEITYDNNGATDGFDQNLTINPSIKVWNNNAWATPATTNTTNIASPNAAYCLFIRGDRNICLAQGINALADNTVLRATGVLNQTGNSFSKSYGAVSAHDRILVGNPYASPVDITKIIQANGSVTNKFWVWDPHINGSYKVGGYVAYSGSAQITVPIDNSYTGGTNAQSGQAFMLEAANASSNISVSFAESNKVTAQTNVFNTITNKNLPAIFANLLVASGKNLSLIDGVGAAFDKAFSKDIDKDDVDKLANFDENMMLYRNGSYLSIELRPVPAITDTLFFKFYLRHQPYTLQIFADNIIENFAGNAWLVDTYLNTKTLLNLADTLLYNFTPNTDTNSYRNRFMIVLKRTLQATAIRANKVLNANNAAGSSNESNSTVGRKSYISVYPNPVIKGSKVMLAFNNIDYGNYKMIISNAEGKQLTAKTMIHNGGNRSFCIQTDNKWSPGTYIVKIAGNKNYNFTAKLIIIK